MSGYKIRTILYSNCETWREIEIPSDITFENLHRIIQKLFGFSDYHMWEFRIPKQDSEEFDLYDIIRTVEIDDAGDILVSEVFDEYDVALYEYDFGDGWEFIIHKTEDTDYDKKTAILTDYAGKYNPIEDIGGIMVFEEIMEALNDDEELGYVLEEYGFDKTYLKSADFEKKFKKGSKILIK